MTPASWHKWFSAPVLVNKNNKVESKIHFNHHFKQKELKIPEPSYLLSSSYNLHSSAMNKISEHS